MATYYSPRLGLLIDARPNGPRVQFVGGVYQTDDKKEQKFIESNRGFNLWIFKVKEDPAPEVGEEAPKAKGGMKKKVDDEAPVEGFDLDSLLPAVEEGE